MNLQQLQSYFSGRMLTHIVLDGWGIGHEDENNAIYLAKTPVMDRLLRDYPSTQLLTHGPHVGLPSEKDMGGSEVGHMTMGAGCVMEQGPTFIKRLIDSGAFFDSPVLNKLIQNCLEYQTPLHLMGLLSDGNIHSHIDHAISIIRYAYKRGVKQLYVHALLDGRDVAIQSALEYTELLEKLFHELKSENSEIDYAFASGGGREAITMDRDQNWSKIEEGWNAHVRGDHPNRFASIEQAILHFREEDPHIIDQALPAFVIERDGQPVGPIRDNHSLIFFNFRADRAIEFTRAVVEDDFSHFDRSPRPNILFSGMTVYDQDTQIPENHLVGSASVDNPLGKRILEAGMKQFRLTETQKFAHVTFFFNGGYKEPLDNKKENYHLIDSDKVPSFDLKPAMKASEIAQQANAFIRSQEYQFGLINFANTDMVGHSGNLEAAIQATEASDQAVGEIIKAVDEVSGLLVITADHGNAEEMRSFNKAKNAWEPNTKHSRNPVPFIIYDPLYRGQYRLKSADVESLNLSHIAATDLIMLGLPAPSDINDPLFVP